jgi:hypothetical protein
MKSKGSLCRPIISGGAIPGSLYRVIVRPLFGYDITVHCGANFSIQHTIPMGRVLAQDGFEQLKRLLPEE